MDDDPSMCELVADTLKRHGYTTRWKTTAEAALAELDGARFGVVLADVNMNGMGGLELCQRVVEAHPDTPVVVMTAFGSVETATGAIRAGAYDFVTKPVDPSTLRLVIDRAMRHRSLNEEVTRLRRELDESRVSEDMIGESAAMKRVSELIARVADTSANVLITGESGTGKELVARSLHRRGGRGDGPFVAINCAAVPENLLESELFGHVRGAFTDAKTAKRGLFLDASGGTLFLDEVGDLPLTMQAKLLRALQERKVRPVGGSQEIAFDARIVSATNRDLEEAVRANEFREDLFYRINVVRIDVPPLRERGNDVLLLAQHFIARAAERDGREVEGLIRDAAASLMAYDWPGNVRELENCMQRAVALARYDHVTVADLPERVREHQSTRIDPGSDDPENLLPMAEVEKRYIYRVLRAVGGNKTRAASVLGLDRRTLYRKLSRYESN